MITELILIEGRESFEEYYQSVATDDIDIQQHIDEEKEHTMRVVRNIQLLSELMLPSVGERRLAELIALFHNIGRLAQYVRFQTLDDRKSEDHALLSAQVIQELDFFTHLPEDVQQLVVKSIESHNKIKPGKADADPSIIYVHLLRDANKLDLFDKTYLRIKQKSLMTLKLPGIELQDNNEVSAKILKSILSSKVASLEDVKSVVDYKLYILSQVYDIHLRKTFQLISDRQLIQKIYDTLPKRDAIIDAYRYIRLFIENQFVSLKQPDITE